ncbi:MAG: hypothetical protein AB7R40_23375 [Nitrospiraceae bacterium]
MYEAKGRWYGGNLIRWFNGVLQGWGGWDIMRYSGGAISLGEAVRGMYVWRRNAGAPVLALGTATKLWIFGTSALTDETPAAFTTGNESASQTSGAFGTGSFGAGLFGVGDEAQDALTEAQSWQFDNWNEDLIAWAYSDKRILYYDSSAASCAALTNAPTDCSGVFVTNENFIMALGPSANPRRISWPDREDPTNWTPGADNFAGFLDLKSKGRVLAGRASSVENLVWTDTDLFAIPFVGGEFTYAPIHRGQATLISRRAAVTFDDKAAWMGDGSFYIYDGEVRPIPSEVADYVFKDLNKTQASKIHGFTRSKFQEIVWHYPSATSLECNRFVVFNWQYGFMYVGDLERSAGVDAEIHGYPIAADSFGVVYRHEIAGSAYKAYADVVSRVEEYSEANAETEMIVGAVGFISDAIIGGQTFDTDGGLITSIEFYLKKTGSPTGNATASIYALDSTDLSVAQATGSPLATTGNFDVSTLTTSYAWITFTFATPFVLPAGAYAVVVSYNGGDSSNHIRMKADHIVTGAPVATHEGRGIYFEDSPAQWGFPSADFPFRINGYAVEELGPYAESGPFELGVGDVVMDINEYIPDQNTLGAVNLTVYTSYFPVETETANGPYAAANPTPIRLNARQVRIRIDQVENGWRFGTPRFDVEPGGLR